MNLDEYQKSQKVRVLMHIPISTTKMGYEWRLGIVVDKKTIHPNYGARFNPYTFLLIKTTRTYYHKNSDSLYNKISIEGFVYNDEVKLK